jgi:hypothetical protein
MIATAPLLLLALSLPAQGPTPGADAGKGSPADEKTTQLLVKLRVLYLKATSAAQQPYRPREVKASLEAIEPIAEDLARLHGDTASGKTAARLVEKLRKLRAQAEEAEGAGRAAVAKSHRVAMLNVVGELVSMSPPPNASRPVLLMGKLQRQRRELEEASRAGRDEETKAATKAILPVVQELFALEKRDQQREELVGIVASLALRHNPASCLSLLPTEAALSFGSVPAPPLPFDYALSVRCSTLAVKLARQLSPWRPKQSRHHPKLAECLEAHALV